MRACSRSCPSWLVVVALCVCASAATARRADGQSAAAPAPAPAPALAPAPAPAPADCGPTPYDCAVAQVGRQDHRGARRTLEQILAKTPRDLKALNLLGIALTLAGTPNEANARFRQALAIDPTFHPARKNLAINEFNAGRLAEAQRHLDLVLTQVPDDEIVHVHLAEIAFRRKQLAAARPHYEKGRARLAQHPRWLLHYATCLLDGGRKADAIALMDQLPATTDADTWFDAGVTLGRYGAAADAARSFAAARKAGYKDAYAAAYNETLMLIDTGNADAAIGVAEALMAQGTKPAELYSLVSRAYVKAKRIKEAYDALREAARLEPAVVEHYIDLAMLCLEYENYDLGLEIVDVGLKHRPDSSMLYLQRGVVLAMKGAVEQAEGDFDRASKAAPDSPTPYVALAMVWMLKGQTPKAVEVLRTRTKGGTPHPVLFYALGMALLRSGAAPDDDAGQEATEAFRTAVRLDATFPQAQAELGKLLLKRGDVPGAIAHLEKATALDPDSAGPAYSLAQAYRRGGQTDRARELLARVSRLNAQERGDDPDTDLRRTIIRFVRADTATGAAPAVTTGVTTGAATGAATGATTGAPIAGPAVGGAAAAGLPTNNSGGAPSPRPSPRERGEGERAASGGPGDEAGAAAATAAAIEAMYRRSAACADAGDTDGAIALLRQAIEAAPTWAEARYTLGLRLWTRFQRAIRGGRKEDLDEAMAQITQAVHLDPAQPSFHLVLGQLLAEHQHFAPAIDHLKRAVALAPGNADHPYNLGLALRLAGDLDAADAQFRAALALNAEHALAHRSLGLVLRQRGDSAGALTELRRAVVLLPEEAQGHHLVGTVLLKQGDVAGAIEAFRRATDLDPSLIEAHVTLAQALAKSGQRGAALKEQAEVQRINVEKADFGRALVLLDSSADLLKKGDAAGAVAQRREAVTLAPSFPEAHYQLGLALREAAAAAAPASARGQPHTPTRTPVPKPAQNSTQRPGHDPTQSAAQVRGESARPSPSRELADAEAAFRQAIALDPTHAGAQRSLAELLDARGDATGAQQARDRAKALAPCSSPRGA